MKKICLLLTFILLINTFPCAFASDISYNGADRTVVLSGTADNYTDGDFVTAMLIKSGADRGKLKPSDLAYIGQTTANSKGEYSFNFAVGENLDFDSLEVYVNCNGRDVTGLLQIFSTISFKCKQTYS